MSIPHSLLAHLNHFIPEKQIEVIPPNVVEKVKYDTLRRQSLKNEIELVKTLQLNDDLLNALSSREVARKMEVESLQDRLEELETLRIEDEIKKTIAMNKLTEIETKLNEPEKELVKKKVIKQKKKPLNLPRAEKGRWK